MNQGLVFHWISLKPKSDIRVYDKLVFVSSRLAASLTNVA